MARKKNKKSTSSSEVAAEKKRKHQSPLTQQQELTNPSSTKNDDDDVKKKQKREKKKSKKALKEEAEERRLTSLLFGGGGAEEGEEDSLQAECNAGNNHQAKAKEAEDFMFEIDRTGAEDAEPPEEQFASLPDDDDDDDSSDGDSNSEEEEEGPAWVDDDDDEIQVDILNTDRLRKLRKTRAEDQPLTGSEFQQRLRARYKSTKQATAQTQWARLDPNEDEEEEDDDDELDDAAAVLQSSSQPLLLQGGAASSARLPPNFLNVVRCPDANQEEYNEAMVQAVNFHPGSDPEKPLLLTAGLDKTLRFFQCSAEKSQKIHGIHFPKLPIISAHFLGDTGKVVVSGRRPFFYIYDSMAGKLDHVPRIVGREEKSWERCFPSPDGKTIAFVGNDGYLILVDVRSKQWMASLKMNGSVRAITFTPDGEYILASGSDGDVYRWEIASRKCVERFTNQDGTITSYLAASSRRQLAVGSESGVVNLYADEVRRRSPGSRMSTEARTPLKSIMNLQTSADALRYNHDGQILALSSRREKQSLKLLHVPTSTVFSNWPTSKTPLGYVSCMDFSPQSKFMALGNDKGKCLLYKLNHYSQQ